MNTIKEAARERLLDASLAEVVGTSQPVRTEPPGPQLQRSRWLAAAVLLLGLGVVITSWFWSERQPDPSGTKQLQDPVHVPPNLPTPAVVMTLEALAGLPADTQSLIVHLPSPDKLEMLARFTSLRQLVILQVELDSVEWASLDDAEALAPLMQLPALERLHLPRSMPVTDQQILALRGLQKLSALSLSNAVLDTARVGRAMASLQLRELKLSLCVVNAVMLRELAASKLLQLELLACPGLDEAAYGAMAQVHSLQSLAVASQNDEGSCAVRGRRYQFRTMGAAAFAALAALPNLRELDLDESHFPDELMARLPAGLRVLRLGDHKMSAASIAALQRLADLEELSVNTGSHHDAAIALLSSLRLRRLELRGWMNDDLVKVLAAHPTLEAVSLRFRENVDLESLTTAPRLRELHLKLDQVPLIGGVPLVGRKQVPIELEEAFDANGIELRVGGSWR